MTNKRPHHHGNLREALIIAGVQLLEEGGVEALSLRKCAAIAGVSHAAPAHHFAGLGSLELAIVSRGHDKFAEYMIDARESAEQTPRARLGAICDGYIKFSRAHFALFKFMFQPRELEPDLFDEATWNQFQVASTASYQVLRDACEPFDHGKAGDQVTEAMVWSMVHGYAMLFSKKPSKLAPFELVPEFSTLLPPLTLKK
ncbi:MAG: TetR/AcrR family transcriptional regulator [Rhizobiaceae bacterium]